MPDMASLLVILSRAPALEAQIARILAPFGWRYRSVAELSAALGLLASDAVAAILVDTASHDPAMLTSAVRGLAAPANGTPILTIGAGAAAPTGAGGHLAVPLDEAAFTELLERWVGPLGDHALRAPPPDARYRLIRLVGFDNASAMLSRFRAALEDAIATAQRDPTAVPAHRLAGLSGMIGFAELHQLWSRVDAGEPDALAPAVETSRQALRALG